MENQQLEDLPKRRERRDALENRERLIAVAKELFATQGVEATNMQDIARTAGVGQGTLYRHFARKSELCDALVHEDIVAFKGRVGAMIDDAALSPLARLETLIVEKVRLTESHLAVLAAMEDGSGGGRHPKPFRGPFRTWMHEQLTTLLTEAVAQNELAPLDIAFTADAILATGAPQLYRYQRYELGYTSERIMAGMRQLFVEGLRRKG